MRNIFHATAVFISANWNVPNYTEELEKLVYKIRWGDILLLERILRQAIRPSSVH